MINTKQHYHSYNGGKKPTSDVELELPSWPWGRRDTGCYRFCAWGLGTGEGDVWGRDITPRQTNPSQFTWVTSWCSTLWPLLAILGSRLQVKVIHISFLNSSYSVWTVQLSSVIQLNLISVNFFNRGIDLGFLSQLHNLIENALWFEQPFSVECNRTGYFVNDSVQEF